MTQSHGDRRKPAVIGTGLIALDIIFGREVENLPQVMAGGTCGNVLAILSFLGWDSYPVARMSGDTASKLVAQDLSRWGVRMDFASATPSASTPIIVQRISQNSSGQSVHRFSWNCPVCGAYLPSYKPVLATSAQQISSKLSTPNVFFLDRVSRGALILAEASAAQGALVVFEPSGVRDPKLFREALEIAHVVKYSHERMGQLGESIASASPPLQIETLGSEGLRYRSNLPSYRTRGWKRLDCWKVESVKDTAGAGDWCTAGLLHYLGRNGAVGLRGLKATELDSAMQLGQALAAWSCGYEGARGGLYCVDRGTMWEDITGIMLRNLSQGVDVNSYDVIFDHEPTNSTPEVTSSNLIAPNTCLHEQPTPPNIVM
jgi:fructokinase